MAAVLSPSFAMASLMAAGAVGCFLLGGLIYGVSGQAFAFALLACIALVLMEIDRRWLILPDVLVALLGLVALAASLWAPLYPEHRLLAGALGGLVASSMLAAVRWAYQLLRHREGMGLGDVKLAFAGGALAGPAGVPAMILVAACATLALAGWSASRENLAVRRLAFGPGLCLGMLVVAVGRHYGFDPLSLAWE